MKKPGTVGWLSDSLDAQEPASNCPFSYLTQRSQTAHSPALTQRSQTAYSPVLAQRPQAAFLSCPHTVESWQHTQVTAQFLWPQTVLTNCLFSCTDSAHKQPHSLALTQRSQNAHSSVLTQRSQTAYSPVLTQRSQIAHFPAQTQLWAFTKTAYSPVVLTERSQTAQLSCPHTALTNCLILLPSLSALTKCLIILLPRTAPTNCLLLLSSHSANKLLVHSPAHSQYAEAELLPTQDAFFLWSRILPL